MTAELLHDLQKRGVSVRAEHGELVLDAPAGVLTDDLLARLREHKAEVLDVLMAGHCPNRPEPRPGDAPRAERPIPATANQPDTCRCGPGSLSSPQAVPDAGAGCEPFPGWTPSGEGWTPSAAPARRDGPQPDGSYIAYNPDRQPVVNVLWPIEQRDPARARDLADAWQERIAIVEADADCRAHAEQVALDELRTLIERQGHE